MTTQGFICPWCQRMFPSLGQMVARWTHGCVRYEDVPTVAGEPDGVEHRARLGSSDSPSKAVATK